MRKATFIVGLGVGYVLGSRAGRERYETLRRTARQVKDSPAVQEAAGVLGAQASQLADSARAKAGAQVSNSLQQGVRSATERLRGAGASLSGPSKG